MDSETSNQEKISPSENPVETPTEIILSLIGMLISIGGLIIIGYIHGKMNIGAVIENLH